jgi:uncharacterized protein (TIGR03067 family)
MRRIKELVAFVLSAAVIVVAASAFAAEAKENKMIGKWAVTKCNKDGKDTECKGKTVVVTKDTITCYKEKEAEMVCKYTADTSSKPCKITLTCTKGEHEGKKLMGIAEVEGDTAKICFSKPGEAAPTSFTSKEGQCYIVLKREGKSSSTSR